MTDNTKAKITIQFHNKTIGIDVDEKDAFSVLDNLLGRGTTTVTSAVTATTTPQIRDDLKVPERFLLLEFIKTKPDYNFSVEDVVQHFIGKSTSELNTPDGIKLLNAIRAKLNRIRIDIETSEKGEWVIEQKGHQKLFSFKKSSGGEVKQNDDKQLTVESYG
jgi:hypothetical protein